MTAPLSPELERFVEEEVHSGHFASREAVIEAALWDLWQRYTACEGFQIGFQSMNEGVP